MYTCSICGAKSNSGETCEELFHQFLTLEFADPEYGQVHFLTVACYMVQHHGYSDEGLVWIRDQLRAFLEQGATTGQLRGNALNWRAEAPDVKVKRQPGSRPLPNVAWRVTAVDVAAVMEDPQAYCQAVTRWGECVLDQMGALL